MTYREWKEWREMCAKHEAELKRRKALKLPPFETNK